MLHETNVKATQIELRYLDIYPLIRSPVSLFIWASLDGSSQGGIIASQQQVTFRDTIESRLSYPLPLFERSRKICMSP